MRYFIWLFLAYFSVLTHAADPLFMVTQEDVGTDGCRSPQFMIFRAALTMLKKDMQCDTTSWRRAQRMVEDGQRDGMITVATAERLRYAVAGKEPILRAEIVLMTRATHPQREKLNRVKHLRDLTGFQLVTYHGDGWVEEHIKPLGIAVDYADNMETVLRKLIAGHGDATIESRLHVMRDIRRYQMQDQIVMLEPIFGFTEYYVLMNKTSPFVEWLPHIDEQLRQMRKNGEYEKLKTQILRGEI